jgi:hypothetical protein
VLPVDDRKRTQRGIAYAAERARVCAQLQPLVWQLELCTAFAAGMLLGAEPAGAGFRTVAPVPDTVGRRARERASEVIAEHRRSGSAIPSCALDELISAYTCGWGASLIP